MTNKKISELPAATTPLDSADLFEVVQGGVNKKVAKSDVATSGTVTSVSGTTNRITSTGGATPVIDIDPAYDAIVAAKAPLASPSFTGTPAAPTASAGTNTTQVATTAFVLDAQLGSVSTSTAGATITLDMNSQIQRIHVGSATFATAKAIAMSNTTNALVFNFSFEVTNVAAVLTVPADWLMASPNFDGAGWTPPATGKYVFGGVWDGTNWYVNAAGPYN